MTADSVAQQILVPIDVTSDSRLAIDLARTIARPGDELTLIHVIPLLDTSGMLLPKSISVDAIAREIRDDAKRRLAMVVDELCMPDGVRVRSIIVDGNPGEEIVHYASRPGSWLVIMETAGKGAARRMMIGSVADHVARSSPVPVLLVREAEGKEPVSPVVKRIVVPLDVSKRSHHALPFASQLAKRLGAPVELVSVRTLEGTAYLYGTAFSLAAYDELDASLQRQARLVLNAAKSELTAQGITVSTSILEGPVAPSIEDSLLPGDLIVMTSHGRSGVRRWLLGSVAEHLVRHGSAPVMLVPAADLPEDDR